jgi:hypothetical protein
MDLSECCNAPESDDYYHICSECEQHHEYNEELPTTLQEQAL